MSRSSENWSWDATQKGMEPSRGQLFCHTLGKRINNIRDIYGRTQADVADASKLSQVTVSKIESGRGNPSYETIVAIADALDVPVPLLTLPSEKVDIEFLSFAKNVLNALTELSGVTNMYFEHEDNFDTIAECFKAILKKERDRRSPSPL